MQLYIGNKNYSSWSLRPWLLMTTLRIAFEEIKLRLDWAPESLFKTELLRLAPTGRVPLLIDDGFAVWDSLAIAEYLADRYSDRQIWPTDMKARARARSLCAEMHSGFSALRNHFPMNVEASLADVGKRVLATNPDAAADLARIDAMWREQLEQRGAETFLFGDFGAADAFYAPVCARIRTYGLPCSEFGAKYVDRILGLPAMQAWCDAARAENDFIADDEPYRDASRNAE